MTPVGQFATDGRGQLFTSRCAQAGPGQTHPAQTCNSAEAGAARPPAGPTRSDSQAPAGLTWVNKLAWEELCRLSHPPSVEEEKLNFYITSCSFGL